MPEPPQPPPSATWELPRTAIDFLGAEWEVTRDHCLQWSRHCFKAFARHPHAVQHLARLVESDLFLLRLDLLLYFARYHRFLIGIGPDPGPIEAYIRPGREEWGVSAYLASAALARQPSLWGDLRDET